MFQIMYIIDVSNYVYCLILIVYTTNTPLMNLIMMFQKLNRILIKSVSFSTCLNCGCAVSILSSFIFTNLLHNEPTSTLFRRAMLATEILFLIR